MRCIALIMLVVMMVMPLHAQETAPAFRLVGYYTSWSAYNDRYVVSDIPADKLTHLNYAFANISAEGEVMLGDEAVDRTNFEQLQRYPDLQTLISVGGWSWSGQFSNVALTAESRARFARSAVHFVQEYGFDGVDIDWEYPTGGGLAGNIERPQDAENFVLLLEELHHQLDAEDYLLTIAVGSGRFAYEPLDWGRIYPLVDWINVMTYDMSGGWSEVTGFNAPLYNSSEHPAEGGSTDTTLQALLAAGVPPEKLVMGVPFYGVGWTGVPATNQGLHQVPTGAELTLTYADLAANYLDQYDRFWHETAQVPWLYNAETQTMIAYDDPESLTLKAEYVRENGLGGMMFWELSGDDAEASLLNALYETLNRE